ncbi:MULTISPECIES: hypothetical protein [Streptomyces]|uniref:Integral membrane protein n=2 Tax=Streptomyces TaxID=1883 RepID=A0A2U9NVR0_STRAS|nr:hypothetical protein [Streptomyces actuosus]AWT41121.1 hypothetical protein DMT42_01445 [Streptomyces actuosus]MBM4826366.1 hypothetical protein [Streptomyces actuosus]
MPSQPSPSSPPPGPDPGVVLSADEHAHYKRLRRAAAVRHRKTRYASASLLLLLALLLAPAALVAAWVDDTVTDTDRYVETVAPLAEEPAVQEVVTDRLTARVVANVDVDAVVAALSKSLADAGAPPAVVDRSAALAGPLRGALTSAVHGIVQRVVSGPVFQQAWEGANRRAHANVVGMLTGDESRAVRAQDDAITLDLGTVVDEVKQRLVDQGFEKADAIPTPDRQVTLFETEQLSKAQDAMRLLDIMGAWLPVITLVLAALAVWIAPAHRVMLLVTACGVAVMMIVLLVGLAVVRRVYLDSVPSSALPADAAAVVYDTFIRFLRSAARTLLVVAVVTALAAYLYGPSRVARGVRSGAGRATGAAGRGLRDAGMDTGTTGRWLDGHRRWTTGVVLGLGALALVLWNHPTVGVVALVAGLVVVVLLVLAVLASATGGRAGGPAAEPGPAGGP